MHGARAIIARTKHTSWIADLPARHSYCVVIEALVNKLALTAWAVLNEGQAFDPEKWNIQLGTA